MKIAVTGASGFLGKHVVDELRGLMEHEIVLAARTLPVELALSSNMSVVQFDLKDIEDAFFRLGEPDLLIHLAWDGLPNYMSTYHFDTELSRQYQFLKQMVLSGTQSIFVTGTCFEYGMQSGALTEDMDCKPVTAYGFAKDCLRQQLTYLKREHEFKLTWARIFYLVGESTRQANLFSALRESVNKGAMHFNMSKGDQQRDYLAVEEVADLISKVALKMLDVGTLNICSGEPITVRRVVEDRIRSMGWHIKLNLGHYSYPEYEPMAFWGDTHKLNSIVRNNRGSKNTAPD